MSSLVESNNTEHEARERPQVNRYLAMPVEQVRAADAVHVTRGRLDAALAAKRAIEKLSVSKEVRDKILAQAQRAALDTLYAEADLGALTKQIPKRQGKRSDKQLADTGVANSKRQVIEALGFETTQSQAFRADRRPSGRD